jgi:hypothetical protein
VSRACSTNVGEENAYGVSVGKSEETRPLGRPRRGWVESIKMHLREKGWDGMDWTDSDLDREDRKSVV